MATYTSKLTEKQFNDFCLEKVIDFHGNTKKLTSKQCYNRAKKILKKLGNSVLFKVENRMLSFTWKTTKIKIIPEVLGIDRIIIDNFEYVIVEL